MTPSRIEPRPKAPPRIQLAEFKQNARRLLPPGHPLLRILNETPDSLPADVLDARLDDWLALLEA